jgi:hypothetical protein
MRRKTGYGERDRSKVNFPVVHCQWGKKGICGNHGASRWMSRHAALHGALGLIVSRRKRGLGVRRSGAMMVMLVHGAITVVRCHGRCMA